MSKAVVGPPRAGRGLGVDGQVLPAGGRRARRQRRMPVVVAGVAMILVAAVAAAGLVQRAGHRVDVLAVARDVPAGQTLSAADLRVASVAADPALKPVPARRLRDLVGQVAAVDLRAGGLLTSSQVARQAASTAGKQIVGIKVERGRMPLGTVQPGDEILAVAVPGGTAAGGASDSTTGAGSSGAEPVAAVVVSVGDAAADGSVLVDLAVSPTDGPALAARAAAGGVVLVQQPRHRGEVAR